MFRKNIIDLQRKRLLGEVSLNQPLSMHLITMATFCIIFSLIVFLSASSYSRKESVKGYLIPESGVIKLYPSQSGTLNTLFVKEGQLVIKGDILANVVLNRPQVNGIDLSENVISILEQQGDLLNRDLEETKLLMISELEALQQKLKDLKLSLRSMDRKIRLFEKKHQIQESKYQQYKHLSHKEFISKLDLQRQEQELLIAKEDLENGYNSKLSLLSQINETRYKIEKLPHETELRITQILRNKSVLERQIKEAQNNYTFSIVAKDTGIVTAISAKEGERLSVNRPLLSVIPQDTELVAELFFPTRSAGFVEPDDEARLRFEAFPYQRFGFITGSVTRIDKSVVVNSEVDVPITLQEPVYRVQVKLTKQSIEAYGESFPLKTGMLLDADIILENRSLLQWLLDPIYSLRGRVG